MLVSKGTSDVSSPFLDRNRNNISKIFFGFFGIPQDQGNDAFRAGRYTEAEKFYTDALNQARIAVRSSVRGHRADTHR